MAFPIYKKEEKEKNINKYCPQGHLINNTDLFFNKCKTCELNKLNKESFDNCDYSSPAWDKLKEAK